MRKNKHIRPINDSKVEIDLPDGTTIIVQATYVSYGHNDRGIGIVWSEILDRSDA